MNDKVHILITGEDGKGRKFLLCKRKLRCGLFFLGGLFLSFNIVAYSTGYLPNTNNNLSDQISSLSSQLEESVTANKALTQQVHSLKQQNSLQEEIFLQEKQMLLDTAVTELEERSSVIERIMCSLGVDIKEAPATESSNSGGPFIAPQEEIGKEILFQSDNVLTTIQFVPLGRPVPGGVSSRFGHRSDPVNGKRGYHSGVDMRGHSGDKIVATADGTVSKAFWNGGYGRYIEIDHGNGYTTKFAHMRAMKVKRGDKVTRGQVIGTVGNSGRSTGSHLHYEICLHNKPVNPSRFMHREKLSQAAAVKELTAKKSKKIKRLLVVDNNRQPATIPEN